MKRILFLGIVVVFLLAACQGGSTAEVTPPAGASGAVPQTGATAASEATTPAADPTVAAAQPPTEAAAEAATFVATEAPAPTEPAQAAVSDDPREAIIESMRKVTQQKSFRVEQTINSPADGTMVMNMDIIPPDRFRMTSEAFGLMIIEGTTYMQASEDLWVQTGSMGDGFTSVFTWINNEEDEEAFRSTVKDVTFVGEEELDGEMTRRYQYDLFDAEQNTHIRNNLWIGEDDLPRKLEVLISTNAAGESDQGSVINVYKDYGSPDIVIEPPG